MVLLDGATGTELGRRGVDTSTKLFSAAAMLTGRGRALLHEVHTEQLEAGAQVITANTFRTNRRAAGPGFPRLAEDAVRIARAAAAPFGARVAGSMAPVADCYRPGLRPPPEVARAEHAEHAQVLRDAGCDLLLVETVAAADEGLAAVAAAAATGLPVWVSAMAAPATGGARGGQAATMLSGDDLAAFFAAARGLGAAAALINCVPCDGVDFALAAAASCGLPFGAYAHMGEIDPASGWPSTEVLSPVGYRERVERWLERGATIAGGCCGTTAAHIRALASLSPRA
jgi:S-methylmethionine-dependent homocysteine/selenocysteine methylase